MKTSQGLIELLQRHQVKPTGDSKKDAELAKKFMPCNWSDMLIKRKVVE